MRRALVAARVLVLVAVLASACEGEPPPPPTTSTPVAPVVPTTIAPALPVTSALSVHEWGLIDVPLSATQASVSAVPACADVPPVFAPSPPPPRPHPIMRPRAPLLYFHLPNGEAPVETTVRVSLAGGTIAEHWPLTNLPSPDTVSWTATVRAEHCAGASYPTTCSPAPCEAIELGAYEASDSSCVRVGDADFADLFYAGALPVVSPVRIVRAGETVTVTNDSDDPLPGPVYLFRRAADRSATLASMAIAQPHSPVTMPPLAPAEQLAVLPFDPMHAQHLSTPEIDAFSRAWSCAVFGGARADGTPCTTEPQPTSFVLFWMPRASIDALAPLVIEPAPAHVERAMLVRVDLDR